MKGKIQIITLFLLLIFMNGVFSQAVFQKTIGGAGREQAYCIQHTADGGYIITGWTSGFGAGDFDVYLVKTDAAGNSLWTKTFGGPGNEEGLSVQQTMDGGYIIGGYTESFGAGFADVYLIRTDSSGNLVWSKTYGGTGIERGHTVQQTSDGGYIINMYPGFDGLLKTDSIGNLLWVKTYGILSSGGTIGSFQQCDDGGFIMVGYAYGTFLSSVYVVKTDSGGNVLWSKIYYETINGYARSVRTTNDGGYIITGYSYSMFSNENTLFIKTDSSGNLSWFKRLSVISHDHGWSAQQTGDGGYVIAAYTYNGWSDDVCLFKADSSSNLLWSKKFGGMYGDDWGYSVLESNDGGYIVAGLTFSYGAGLDDVYLIKTDSSGNSGCNETNPQVTVITPFVIDSNVTSIATVMTLTVDSPSTVIGTGGTDSTLCTTVGIQPGIAEPQDAIIISPNPFNESFTITLRNVVKNGTVRIYNILGEQVLNACIINESVKDIRLINAPEGVYFVKVFVYPDLTGNGERTYSRKLIVKRD